MSGCAVVSELNRELARKINEEARDNPQSPLARKFVAIVSGQIVGVADPAMTKLKSEYKGATWDVGSYRVMFVDGEKKQRTISTSMLAFGQPVSELGRVVVGEFRQAGAGQVCEHGVDGFL